MTFDIDPSCYIAPTATIIGNVTLGPGVGVWFGAVIRADLDKIVIGEGSNVQDNCIVHVTTDTPTIIGKNVSIGHGSIVHGATIEDDVIIGMNATVMNDVVVGAGSIVGANAMVKEGMNIPPGSLVLGVPAKIVKENVEGLREAARVNARTYHRLRDEHKAGKHEIYKP